MGKVIVTAKLTNRDDLILAEHGYISENEIHSLEVEGIIDTGAVLVSLPQKIVDELRLKESEKRKVRYANGDVVEKSIAGGLLIEIQGRTSETRCIIEPNSSTVLIGQIPLEEMDWMVHPQKQILVSGHEGFDQGLIEMY